MIRSDRCLRSLPSQLICVLSFGIATLGAGAQEDMSSIRDQKARDAATQIQEMLADVQEYVCGGEISLRTAGEVRGKEVRNHIVDQIEWNFRRPNLAVHRGTSVKTVLPAWEGKKTDTYYNAAYRWTIETYPPGAGEKLADAKKMPPGLKRIAFINSYRQPKATKFDLNKFRDAGLADYFRDSIDVLLNPFKHCEIETITIEREDDEVWVFVANPRQGWDHPMKFISIRLTIGKSDGVVRETAYDGNEGNDWTFSISDVRLNPDLDDSVFEFTPPEGIDVEDGTDGMIEALLRMREYSRENKLSS